MAPLVIWRGCCDFLVKLSYWRGRSFVWNYSSTIKLQELLAILRCSKNFFHLFVQQRGYLLNQSDELRRKFSIHRPFEGCKPPQEFPGLFTANVQNGTFDLANLMKKCSVFEHSSFRYLGPTERNPVPNRFKLVWNWFLCLVNQTKSLGYFTTEQ